MRLCPRFPDLIGPHADAFHVSVEEATSTSKLDTYNECLARWLHLRTFRFVSISLLQFDVFSFVSLSASNVTPHDTTCFKWLLTTRLHIIAPIQIRRVLLIRTSIMATLRWVMLLQKRIRLSVE